MRLLLAFTLFLTSFAQLEAQVGEGLPLVPYVYACQKYYATADCTGPVIGMASKKYGRCQPYLFEADAAGKYFDMLGKGGHCDKTCTHCEVEAPAITQDIMVGGKNEICRSQKYLGLSEETTPTWNFIPGPCPDLCEQMYAKHPGCDDNYDGDLPCEPSQDEFDYAPQCFEILTNAQTADVGGWCEDSPDQKCRSICPEPSCPDNQCAMRKRGCCKYRCTDVDTAQDNTESSLASQNQNLARVNKALLEALQALQN